MIHRFILTLAVILGLSTIAPSDVHLPLVSHGRLSANANYDIGSPHFWRAQDRKLTLATPQVEQTTTFEPIRLVIDLKTPTIYVFVEDNRGVVKEFQYQDIPAVPEVKDAQGNITQVAVAGKPDATNIINALNPQLRRAIIIRLQADKKLAAGTIGGAQ